VVHYLHLLLTRPLHSFYTIDVVAICFGGWPFFARGFFGGGGLWARGVCVCCFLCLLVFGFLLFFFTGRFLYRWSFFELVVFL